MNSYAFIDCQRNWQTKSGTSFSLGITLLARQIGKQLVRAADSVGANIAEGSGRGTFADNKRFVRIGRGSFHETQYWLRRAYKRQLLTSAQIDRLKPLVDELGPTLNAYLRSIGEYFRRPKDAEGFSAAKKTNGQLTTDY